MKVAAPQKYPSPLVPITSEVNNFYDAPIQKPVLPGWTTPPKPGLIIKSRNMNNEPIFSKPKSDLKRPSLSPRQVSMRSLNVPYSPSIPALERQIRTRKPRVKLMPTMSKPPTIKVRQPKKPMFAYNGAHIAYHNKSA